MNIKVYNRSTGRLVLVALLLCVAATVVTKISDYPRVTTPADTDIIILSSGATNKGITYLNLAASIVRSNVHVSVNGTSFLGNFNLTNSASVSYSIDGTGSNVTATASGGVGSTNYRSSVITLTVTGTNVDANQIDWNLTNQCYRLTLTTNVFFGDTVCTNVPATNLFQWLQLNVLQDSTGGRTITFTNSIYAGVNGTFALTTNASAWDSFTLINSPQTNGNVAVLPVNNLRR